MSEPAPILESENISVVDDVSNHVPDLVEDLDGQDVEVRDLGDGYVEINGYVFHENWEEIDPPECEDEPEIPHEEVVAFMRERRANRRTER